MRELVMGVS